MRSLRTQYGFINPFVDFLFGVFGSLLVLSLVFLALIGEPEEEVVSGFMMIEFENSPDNCVTSRKVTFGVAIKTATGIIWADESQPGLQFVPAALSTDRQIIIVRGFRMDAPGEMYLYLADILDGACVGKDFAIAIKSVGHATQRIVLRIGHGARRACTLSEDIKPTCV